MSDLSRREEMATRIACAVIQSASNGDPLTRLSVIDVAEVSANLADRIIDACAVTEIAAARKHSGAR